MERVKDSEAVAVLVDKETVEGEEEVEAVAVVVRKKGKRLKQEDRGRKIRVDTIHGKVKKLVTVLETENQQTETPNLLVPKPVTNSSRMERSQELQRLQDRREKVIKASKKVKERLSVEVEVAEEVEEAEAAEMVQRLAMLPTRRSNITPQADNSEDLTLESYSLKSPPELSSARIEVLDQTDMIFRRRCCT